MRVTQRALARPALAVAALLFLVGCGTTTPLTSTTTTTAGLGAELGRSSGEVLPASSGPAGSSGTTGVGALPVGSSGAVVPGSTGSTGTTGGAIASDSSRGPAGRKPIVVGFIAADYAKLVATVGGSTTSDPHAVTRALVKAINARGGLAGRQIKPVYFTVDGTATDYASQEQAACASFTQDNHAELVIGGGVGSQTLYGCLLDKGVPFITGNPTEGVDSIEMQKYPNVFDVPGMAEDRQAAAMIDQSVRTGWLSKKNKLGVLHSGCEWGKRTYNNVVLPRARQLGIGVEEFDMGCPAEGAGSVPQTSSSVQSAALQFRGAGVDRVMIVDGGGDAATYLLFANNADSQKWYPGYIVGSNAVAQAWVQAGVVSRQQAAGTHGAGWVPVVDTTGPPQSPRMKQCTALAKSGGAPAEQVPGQFGLICDAFWAVGDALVRSGGVGGMRALRPALESLGTSLLGAGPLGGAISLGPSKHDGAAKVAPFAYLASCSCFRYQASPQAFA